MRPRRLKLATMGPVLIGLLLAIVFSLALIFSTRASAAAVQQAAKVSGRTIVSTAAGQLSNSLQTLDVGALESMLIQYVDESSIVYVGVRNASGYIVAESESGWEPDERTSRDLAIQALSESGFVQQQVSDRLVLVRPIAVGPEQLGTVEFVFSQSLLQTTLGTAQRTISLATVVAFAGAMLAITVMARMVTAPLADLATVAEGIGHGQLDVPVRIRGTEEIAKLATAVEQMRARLEETYASLEQRVASRTAALEAAADVSRTTTSVLDPGELVRQVVDLVRNRFGLYYVGLFLLDETGRYAVLRAGTGAAGRQMLAQGHQLAAGGNSMIGRCVGRDEPRIALDVGREAVRFENPLLPDTRSELALPMRSRGRVIGAMTVQSADAAAFDPAYITVLQTMADQVAVAIANARLFADAQTALEDLEAIQQRYLGDAWAQHTQERGVRGYAQTQSGLLTLDQQILPEVHRAIAAGHPVISRGRTARGTETQVRPADHREAEGAELRSDAGAQLSALVVPILFGNQPIGALGLRDVTGRRHWGEVDVGLVQAISEQFAQAAESLRLLDETQRSAAREKTVTRVTARLRETFDMDTVLQTAAYEMWDVLNLAEAEVRIGAGSTSDEISREALAQMLQGRADIGYVCGAQGIQAVEGQWRSELARAAASGQIVHDDGPILAIPITIRDHVAGAIRLRKPDGALAWTGEEISLMELLTERLGVALESARLYQDTQRRQAREQLTFQIAEQVRGALDIEEIMRVAARSLGRELNASEVVVRLGTERKLLGETDSRGTHPPVV